MKFELEREEVQALLQISKRGQFSGEEVIAVATIMEKLQSFLMSPSATISTEKPHLKKKSG